MARHCTALNCGAVLDLKSYLKRDNKGNKRNKEAEGAKKRICKYDSSGMISVKSVLFYDLN